MWKRFQGHGRDKERHAHIGNPVLLETTYDEDQLRRNPDVTDVQNATYQHNAPPSQPYLSWPEDYPDYRASTTPTVSSVYSRPSNDLYYYDNPVATSPSAYEDISPPSSPDSEQQQHLRQPRRYRSMRDVSPIDETRGKPQTADAPHKTTNIPVLRKAPPIVRTGESQPSQKFWGVKLAPNSKVKWDTYSGEPTSGDAGISQSVTPASYKGTGLPDVRPMGYHVSVSGPEIKKNVSLVERMGSLRVKTPPSMETTKPREPWSRTTGRSQIAPALRDEISRKPLQLPRKTEAREVDRADQVASNKHTTPAAQVPVAAETTLVADDIYNFDAHESAIKPIPPLKIGKNIAPRNLTSPISPINIGLGIQTPYSYPSPVTPTQAQQSLPPTAVNEPTEVWTQSREHTAIPERDTEPSNSRFSWTTYNSATTYQHSPPPSPPPPAMPTHTQVQRPRIVTEPISAASSILSRRRPVPQAGQLPSPVAQTARKPIPTPSVTPTTAKIRTFSPPSPRPASTLSTTTNKALPQPPTTLSASDHVSLLESQMEDLRIRRNNVHRLLDDLNKAAPANPLITDFKRARLVEQRKRAYADELAEIKAEEYDVGMKLHRAWKKREFEDPNQGSALWIRRVTG
ncbi:hypothetical protein P153DRAFT_282336 [Dothidotthia symphoricarpi CBS 119687]|uniref:Uncharacterized protein n=1 Tax=Dothidotthia symphoricarpi CBS 119687 TaxID=1392245 RepID=A0A6A6ARQ9_9PLEO|nr:uncharacterized protein P153DRAFT_282336 [Dothidotthia symphoricarpi CBS 119687]KAF2133527.1 hypothetical protein P153DRAFT_282336 [Dothidotthia symphoricarpi CBS 119687]